MIAPRPRKELITVGICESGGATVVEDAAHDSIHLLLPLWRQILLPDTANVATKYFASNAMLRGIHRNYKSWGDRRTPIPQAE